MKKRLVVSGILLAGLMLATYAFANPYGYGQGNHPGGDQHSVNHDQLDNEKVQQNVADRIAQMDAFLTLDEYQKVQIEKVLSTYWQNQQGSATEHTNRHDSMHSSDQDEANLRQVMVKRAELRAEQIIKQRKLQKDLVAIFTEEQRQKADKVWSTGGHHTGDMNFGGHGS